MEFEQRADGERVPLPFQSVDTGMGLERLTQRVIQQVPTELRHGLRLTPIHAAMRELLGHDPGKFEAERFSYQVIADHSRAVTFLVADGVAPSNEGRGYVLRRILRRAVRHGRLLGRREPFIDVTAGVVIDVMKDAYPYLEEQRDKILGVIRKEETHSRAHSETGTTHLMRCRSRTRTPMSSVCHATSCLTQRQWSRVRGETRQLRRDAVLDRPEPRGGR